MKRRTLIGALLVSVAFNLGFSAKLALQWSRARSEQPSVVGRMDCYPAEFRELCSRLEAEVQKLRVEQAEHTRRLAELMAAEEPENEAIGACLDELSRTERLIKGAEIDTVLAQRATLGPEDVEKFCSHVRNRLCTPWADCRPAEGCEANHEREDGDCLGRSTPTANPNAK